jgi:predicted DNA-binding WGR domain protein
MDTRHPEPVFLTRRDPAQNMARFYTISMLPTLFGEVALVRNWGRIGTRGQVMTQTFENANDAEAARVQLERHKRRRGYSTSWDALTSVPPQALA